VGGICDKENMCYKEHMVGWNVLCLYPIGEYFKKDKYLLVVYMYATLLFLPMYILMVNL
jgi:hypothetical protein